MLYNCICNWILLRLILAPLAAVADHTPFLLVHDTVSPKKPVMIYRFQAY